MSTATEETWDDTKFTGLIGEHKVHVLSTIKEVSDDSTDTNLVVLFRYADDGGTNIYALRWKLGAILDLGTSDLDAAKGAIMTMFALDAGVNDND